jgi:UDP-N-acetylmuramoylalanine--D-glutamate ligase
VDAAGKTVAVAGNIGPTLLDTLAKHLDEDTLPEVWVLELSSFQLDGRERLRPAGGHGAQRDAGPPGLAWRAWRPTRGQGARFRQHGLMVLNREDPLVMAMPACSRQGQGRPQRA